MASASVPEIPKKKTMGRRKIVMERIQDKCRRHVAFSRRRSGLFKKAKELSALCGSEVVVIVFSESGKTYTCGAPDAESVLHRYFLGRHQMVAPTNPLAEIPAPSPTLIDYFNSPSQSTKMVAEPSNDHVESLENDVNTSLSMM